MPKTPPTSSGMDIPDYPFEAIARCLLPKIQDYYASEEGQQAFAQWQAKKLAEQEENTGSK